MTFRLKLLPVIVGAVLIQLPVAATAAQEETQALIIQTEGSLSNLARLIQSLGGSVQYEYGNLSAIAADMPASAMAEIQNASPSLTITKDVMVAAPGTLGLMDGRAPGGALQESFSLTDIPASPPRSIGDVTSFANAHPGAYDLNHLSDNVLGLHQDGYTGDGVVVAVIDSGLRPGYIDFDVAGCIDFVALYMPADTNGCMNPANSGHGTMVSALIAGASTYEFQTFPDTVSSIFLNSVIANAGRAALDLNGDLVPETVAAIGSAPGAEIFMMRVFADEFTPAPSSLILYALDTLIGIKKSGVNIRVANLSLGGFTLFAGKDALDIAHDRLLENGIVPVAAAGNTGPATLTTASPASAYSTIAVGAGSQASQERIAADVAFCEVYIPPIGGFGCFAPSGAVVFPDGAGPVFRPFNPGQTAFFSARGPNADGRTAPDVMADGFAFGAGLGAVPGTVSLGMGTSFSSATVAGIVALMVEKHGTAVSPTQIRNAIVSTGNPTIIDDGSTELDEGSGWVDAAAADALMASGKVPSSLPRPPHATPIVAANVRRGSDLEIRTGNFTARVDALGPGQRVDYLYLVRDSDKAFNITISDIQVLPAGCTESPWFGEDELRLAVHAAKTSAFPPSGFYYDLHPSPQSNHAFISRTDLNDPAAPGILPGACGNGECRVTISDPEPGLARISLSGATENACRVSARVQVRRDNDTGDRNSRTGRISNMQFVPLTMTLDKGVDRLEFELSWQNDWSRYPTNDLDLGVFLPSCPGCPPLPILQTLDSPEKFTLTPIVLGEIFYGPGGPLVPLPAGDWEIVVGGFAVHERADQWTLRVTANGKVVKLK